MQVVVEQGGLAPGGLNFDCKVRRESNHVEDLFFAHVAGMDQLALGLRRAVAIVQDGTLAKMKAHRYRKWDEGFGKKIEHGQVGLEECAEYVQKRPQPVVESGQEEKFKMVHARLLSSKL